MKFFFLVSLFLFFVFCFLPPKPFLSLSLVIFLQIHNKYTSLEIISIILTASVVHYLLSITCVMNWHWWPGKYFMEVQIFVSFPLAVLSIYSPCHSQRKKKQKKLFPYVLFYIVFESRSNQWLKLCCGIINAFLYEKFVHKTLLYYHRKKKMKKNKRICELAEIKTMTQLLN